MRGEKLHGLLQITVIAALGVWALGLVGCNTGVTPGNANEDPGRPLPVETEGQGTVDQEWDGSTVTLTAVPDEGWQFAEWSGSVDSQENPLTVTVTDSTSISVRFVPVEPGADEDGDGVLDEDDLCPDTPAGAEVDEEGCPVEPEPDADADGVPDDDDQCPDTPADAEVDQDGCADSQKDTDGDGITDDIDECQDTPPGTPVTPVGCAFEPGRDTDHDGVPDNIDECPNTPTGAEVDQEGCADSQRDSDRDGVTDDLDACPGTPLGVDVDAAGCPVVLPDADGDGVPDDDDQCPNTPAGAAVDENGCADSDGDGVTDDIDECPDTPPGTSVDQVGCPSSGPPPPPPPPPVCGNGVVESGEQCEPPDTPTCDANCQSITTPVCGNGVIEEGEECDPPDGVTCDANCQSITGPVCGDGAVEGDEECDDGNLVDGDGCDSNCTVTACGNGIITGDEACDPPDGVSCDEDCQIIPCSPVSGSCCAANGTPGCDDVTCCEIVCAADPYCCEYEWDNDCVLGAIDLCGFEVANDDCDNPTNVEDGSLSFDNLCATTDGPEETGDCEYLRSDVWFCYQASCTGFATVSLCGSDYDTVLAVYDECGCPAEGASMIACSDDDCGLFALDSRVMFAVEEGQSFTIRVGGYQGDRGEGMITIFCGADDEPWPACGPGAGDCFSANGTPGCEDTECCVEICTQDPYCCDVDWDNICAGRAAGFCGEGFVTCGPGNGDCATANGTPGCDDEACCQMVCAADPYCCLVDWDDLCAEAAADCP